jgi:hypothetical protein
MSTLQRATITLPSDFEFNEVKPNLTGPAAPAANPPLGAIAPFAGITFRGNGFNNIFRPQNAASPTPLPVTPPGPLSDNILELNLTQETLSFSPALGNVPNRGFAQKDLFLNGVPYVQSINDVTFPGQSPTIHFEPGIWLAVPATTNPAINEVTYVRMASIPHGVTIEAEGTAIGPTPGSPNIPVANMNPFPIGGVQPPPGTVPPPFPSQTATNTNTPRIPQDLTSYIAAGTITQFILNDPNTLLRNHLVGQTILNFTTIIISTQPALPIFGGGTDNIAFLLGDNNTPPHNPNADAIKMTAVFWVETVQETIIVPIFKPGQPPLSIKGAARPGAPTPVFSVQPPIEITAPRPITITFTQIQYSQTVFLNFNTLTWPHITVATLIPGDPIPVPPSVWG